jgi:bacteriorhodopsin
MLYESAYISLIIQIVVGIIDIFGLNINIPDNKMIFRDLLKVELGVQTVEFIFYAWMVYNFKNISNITPYRYFDWIITTPTMLLTLMAYLDNKSPSLIDYIKNNKKLIINVVFFNLLMLISGLFGELNCINYYLAIILGFFPFVYYFKLIYDKYIKDKQIDNTRKNLFLFFC